MQVPNITFKSNNSVSDSLLSYKIKLFHIYTLAGRLKKQETR